MIYDLDSHKLHLFPERVALWRQDPALAQPITVEVSPVSFCNQRCNFCAFTYLHNAGSSTKLSPERLAELAINLAAYPDRGPASIVWGGEGEPTLHPDLPTVIRAVRRVPQGLITNGTSESMPSLVPYLSWIRVSLNARTAELFSKIHGVAPTILKDVLDNLAASVEVKREQELPTTIGVQALLFEENADDCLELAKLVKQIGVDYFVVKPYSHHPHNEMEPPAVPSEARAKTLARQIEALSTETFSAVFRHQAFSDAETEKAYAGCLAAPFYHFVAADGRVYWCASFVGYDEYAMGNVNYSTWQEIMLSARRKGLMYHAAKMSTGGCRNPCRLDAANRYLHRCRRRDPHDAFL